MTVAVLGNAAIDLVLEVETVPRPGQSVAAASKRQDFGGKGLNQAIAARRAGARVRLCAAIGRDAHGDAIASRLAAEGIDPSSLLRRPQPTDESLIFVIPGGENAILGVSPPGGAPDPDAVRAFLAPCHPRDPLVVSGDLPHPTLSAALHGARERGMYAILNPSPVAFDGGDLLPLVDLLVVNRREARRHGGDPDPGRGASRLLATGIGGLVVTLGAAGAVWFEGTERLAVPAPQVEAVDTTGAGDLLLGVLAAGIDLGLPPPIALRRAVAAASRSVTRSGTLASFPERAEMEALFARLEEEGTFPRE